MSSRARWLPLVGLILLLAAPVSADVPRTLNFQGRLADGVGMPLNGQYTITFSLYTVTSGGTPCSSAAQAVYVNAGLFNANITVNAACTFAAPYYMGIKVGGDAEMTPRLALSSAPYAMAAAALVTGTAAYRVGNAQGDIPFVNGSALNVGLNADMVRTRHSSNLSVSGHTHRGIAIYKCYRQFSNGTYAYFLTQTGGTNCYSIGYLHQ